MKALLAALLAAVLVYLLYDTWTQKNPVLPRSGRLCDYIAAGSVFEDHREAIRRGIRLLEVHIYSDERDQPVVATSPQTGGSNVAVDNVSFESVCVDIANDAFPSKDPFILSMVLHTDRTVTIDKVAEHLLTIPRKFLSSDTNVRTAPLDRLANTLLLVSGGTVNGTALESLTEASESVAKLSANLDRLLLGEDDTFSKMVQKTEKALDAFSLAMDNINDVMGDANARANLKQTLNGLPEVINDLRTTVQGIGTTVDTADRNLRNLEGLTRPLGERGEGMVAQVDKTIGRLDETLQQAVLFTRALNESEGTLGKLVRDPKVYDDLAQAAANVNKLTKELRPIVDDVRVFTDKIARHPEQLGVRGALDRRPGLK